MNPFFTRPKKILLIKLRPLGESVLLSSSLQALRKAFPDTQLHLAVATPAAPLFIHHPGITRIWPVDRHAEKLSRARAIARAAFKLRSENFDGVINLHASPSSATLAFATGARVRSIHFHFEKKKNRYSTVAIPDQGLIKPMIEKDFDALRALGVAISPSEFLPTIHLKPGEMDEAFRLLQSLGLQKPILALGLGSSKPTKSWSMSSFGNLVDRWRTDHGGSTLLITGSNQSQLAHQVRAQLTDQAKLANLHEPSLRLLSAVLTQCSAFAGNDSGIRHVAAASGLPTVTLFGPEDPQEWSFYPTDRHRNLFLKGLACRRDGPPEGPEWCALRECVIENHRCMREISPDQVLKTVIQVMK